jgi:glucose dehydrogenase
MRTRRFVFALSVFAISSGAQTDWPTFGHDSGSNRYSQLKQITSANVS